MFSSYCDNDPSVTLEQTNECVRNTTLVWVPIAFFVVTFPFLIAQCYLTGQRFERLPYSAHFCVKLALTAVLAANSFFVWCSVIFSTQPSSPIGYCTALWTIVWGGTFAVHLVRQRCGLVSSGIQHLTAVLFSIFGAPEFYHAITSENLKKVDSNLTTAYLIWYLTLLLYTASLCFADPRNRHVNGYHSPELNSSFLNRITLWWFNPVPRAGAKRDLELDDIFDLNERNKSEYLSQLWESVWEPKREKYINEKSNWVKEPSNQKTSIRTAHPRLPSIVLTLFTMFRWEVLFTFALKFASDTMQFAFPFLLKELLDFVSAPNAHFWKGLTLCILMFTVAEVRSLIMNSYFYIMFRMGTKIQATLTAAVYKKTLLLSNAARRNRTIGEIVNLMSIDVERFQSITPQIHQFWSCPYQITFALVYLLITLGYSALPGIVIMVVFVPTNILSSIIIRKWQVEQMKCKDERTKMMSEILNGIRVVKLYAWEFPMEEHIEAIRNKELALIKKCNTVKNVLDSFNVACPFFVALSSFGTFVLSNPTHHLTPQVAFVSLALFNLLRSPTYTIALLINQAVQTVVSNKRLKEFLNDDEIDGNAISRSDDIHHCEHSVLVDGLTASWEENVAENKATLVNLQFHVLRESLVAVVGKVGSGKSSLLQAILGEMEKIKGHVKVNGRIAYVPQQPWIQNMSLRENIIFGKSFDEKRYDEVLYACALKPDIQMLPAGDRTEIGEKGINLSGGQKARVSLARAVYQNLDVYLLDDPLSAVDAHVGRHIFENVIGPNGLLKGKTRILATHGLTYTKYADKILVLKNGRIEESGAYEVLIKNRGVFFNFMKEYEESSEKSEKSEKSTDISDQGPLENVKNMMNAPSLGDHKSYETPLLKTKEVSDESKLIKKEEIARGKVELANYQMYAKAAGYIITLGYIVFYTTYLVFQLLRNFWLSAWSNEYDPDNLAPYPMSVGWRLGVFGILGLAETVCFSLGLLVIVYVGQRASKNLHSPLIHNLLRSPMSFYDTTPIGRILNRCSKDIDMIDMGLPLNLRYLVLCVSQVIFTLIAIIISTPLFAIVILPLTVIYLIFLKHYVPTSRQLKRLESVNCSPVYSHFGETIQGAATIRAFNKVDDFREHGGRIVDTFMRCRYSSLVANRWLAIRLEFIGSCIVLFAALFAVISKEFEWTISPGIIGVSISYAIHVTEKLNLAVRGVAEAESNIVSVERVVEYTNTANEAEWRIESKTPAENWPSQGAVRFEKFSIRYREGLELVLREITAEIRPGEKIGIVGRTGAGKSSFALALFRLIESAEGKIVIDDVDVSTIGLHDLRSHITIIPQDPVLFSGTLRFNLDPFSMYSDDQLWEALDLAHLKNFTSDLSEGLLYKISEGGENLSLGQRQLVTLARALLRHTKILVLDEATAAVDVTTDALIQETIRSEFKECTVFTIAHRLNTIMDYDRVMVLDNGAILEFDSPDVLMADKNSTFAKMVADSLKREKKD